MSRLAQTKPTIAQRREAAMASVWQEDLSTLTDAVVRISRILESLLHLVNEERQKETEAQEVGVHG